MSNPPSVYAPTPLFSGIIYNPSDFIENSTTAVLTYAEALKLFLQKNTPIPLNYLPSAITTTSQLGYTVNDTITGTTIANGSATNAFSTAITLSTGVWLINYSLRLEPTSGSSLITLYSTTAQDSTSVVYAQSSLGFTNITANSGQGLCSNGSFVIKSNGSTTYNVVAYALYTGGTSFGFVKTGSNPSLIQRTRIG
jgi:hypothetical protein